MPMRMLTALLVSLLAATSVAWLVALLHEKGVRPVQDLVAFFRKRSKAGRVILGTFFIAMWVIASTKPGDGGGDGGGEGGGGDGGTNNVQNVANVEMLPMTNANVQLELNATLENGNIGTGNNFTMATLNGAPAPVTDQWSDFTPITSTNTTRTLDGDDFRRRFVMYRIGTGEAFGFAAPSGAVVCADWRAFGAAEDWTYANVEWKIENGELWGGVLSNETMRLRIHSEGWAEVPGGSRLSRPDGADATSASLPQDQAHPVFVPSDGNTLVESFTIPSTPKQDIEMLNRIRSQIGNPPLYSFFFNNCIHWANEVIEYGMDQ